MPKKRRARPAIRSKRTEKSPRQSQAHIRAVLDAALDAVIGMNSDGIITDWNKRADVIFGWTRDEAMGRKLVDTIIPLQYRDAHERGFQRFLAGGEGPILNRRIEITALRRNGTEFPVELTVTPLKVGKSYAFSAFVADITERKRAEEALRESEARYRTVLRATNDVIWEWDLKTNALWWSNNFFELFGYRPEEIEPGAESWSTRIHPDERDRILSEVQAAIQNRQPFWSGEYRFRRADGSYAYLYDRGYLHVDESGTPARMTGSLMDITARKRAEEELHQREEQLWQLLAERGQLSQDLHDNIIQKIYATGLNLEESAQLLTEDSDAAARNLTQAIADLNGVIREVRNYIDRIDPSAISTTSLRAELAKLVQGAQGALLPRFRLRLDPIAISRLNTEQARQVLYIAREALSNSLRHSHARSGFVSLLTQYDRLRLEIADDGVGFDGRQGDQSGHGLRNMAARAQKLGGRLEVISAPGQGTRIIVDIPKGSIHV